MNVFDQRTIVSLDIELARAAMMIKSRSPQPEYRRKNGHAIA
jgi:hypothetical protein